MDDEHKKGKNYMEHSQHKKLKTFETATWTLSVVAFVLAVALIAAIVTNGFGGGVKGLTQEEAKTKTIDYLNTLLGTQGGGTATIDSIKDEGDLYSMKINIAGKIYDSYVRKDGSILFPTGIDMTQKVPDAGAQADAQPADTNIPKTDKPTVELFVMSHCPYGTQSEKGILPAIRILGDDVDFKIKFVYYAMHGKKEVDEQLRQYCIQKEQPEVFNAYLACFLNASDSPGCLASTDVDTDKLDTCVAAADTEFEVTKNLNDQSSWLSGQFPLFKTDYADNQKYSVGGSPTLVINGVQSNAGRSPASYLSAICNAMTTPSEACSTQLSAVNPGPGFGYDSTAAATAAGCGV